MPYVVAGALMAWMTAHGRRVRREGERRAAETAAEGIAEAPAEAAATPPAPVAASSCAA
jgi:hypothetical protein